MRVSALIGDEVIFVEPDATLVDPNDNEYLWSFVVRRETFGQRQGCKNGNRQWNVSSTS